MGWRISTSRLLHPRSPDSWLTAVSLSWPQPPSRRKHIDQRGILGTRSTLCTCQEASRSRRNSESLNALRSAIPSAVVNWRYTIGEDWSGDSAIFFWVTLSDEAAKRRNLPDATRQIIDLVNQQVNPLGQWGLIPYFSFRSQSEQGRLREEVFS